MIKISKLDKYFNKGKSNEIHVIDDVSLELPDSGMVALFGKSGCGKTTLLNVLGGLDGFAGGAVEIDGADIRVGTDDLRNRNIGYIFQNYNLNREQTCYENVENALRLCGMTDPDEIDGRVAAALANVGMDKFAKRLPDTLSGGQQQRIAIARAIVKNPRIILADEPTGNLDEANTLVVMEILRAIAKEHLVVLVTHEAHLVDYYCDKVIELGDGKVLSVRDNQSVGGYTARDKNTVYLGELDKRELNGDAVNIGYYGDSPQTPVRLKIVNSGGKLYLRVDTPGVHIVDESGEIRFDDGVFERGAPTAAVQSVDMSELPPVKSDGKCGRLFTFGAAARGGLKTHFVKKRSRIFFRRLMLLFAAVFVLVSAVFGTSFRKLIDLSNSYSHNTFYLRVENGEQSDRLNAAVGRADSGIDYVTIDRTGMPNGAVSVRLQTGRFETFSIMRVDGNYARNAVVLGASVCGGTLRAGRKDGLAKNEAVISSMLADEFLKNSTLGYIEDYDDLLGMWVTVGDSAAIIAGVATADEPVVYMPDLTVAKSSIAQSQSCIRRASDFSMELDDGEVVYLANVQKNLDVPLDGKLMLHGAEFKLVGKFDNYMGCVSDYAEWLNAKAYKRVDEFDFITALLPDSVPDDIDDADFIKAYDEYYQAHYYEYLDYFYEYYEEYLRFAAAFGSGTADGFNAWMYVVKGETALYDYLTDQNGYYYARTYKAQNGVYPTVADANKSNAECNAALAAEIARLKSKYSTEYYKYAYNQNINYVNFFVNDAEFIRLSKRAGDTHSMASSYFWQDDIVTGVPFNGYYMRVHSSDPNRTEKFLRAFGDSRLLTPADVKEELSQDSEVMTSLIALAVVVVLLSLCMYFIMRSALMSRIKEIGIYRAIGVSKKNLVFKFFVEALLLTTLTVFIGYLIMSGFLAALGTSSLMGYILYYPFWYALIVLAVLYGVCILCGILPVLTLLRKSPSAILSKYDI